MPRKRETNSAPSSVPPPPQFLDFLRRCVRGMIVRGMGRSDGRIIPLTIIPLTTAFPGLSDSGEIGRGMFGKGIIHGMVCSPFLCRIFPCRSFRCLRARPQFHPCSSAVPTAFLRFNCFGIQPPTGTGPKAQGRNARAAQSSRTAPARGGMGDAGREKGVSAKGSAGVRPRYILVLFR